MSKMQKAVRGDPTDKVGKERRKNKCGVSCYVGLEGIIGFMNLKNLKLIGVVGVAEGGNIQCMI